MNGTELCQMISNYFDVQYNLERLILEVLQNKNDIEENMENLFDFIRNNKISQNKEDLLLLMKFLLSLSNNFQRVDNFFQIIEKIFMFCKKEILDFYENVELFKLFKTNKRILLFFFKMVF